MCALGMQTAEKTGEVFEAGIMMNGSVVRIKSAGCRAPIVASFPFL